MPEWLELPIPNWELRVPKQLFHAQWVQVTDSYFRQFPSGGISTSATFATQVDSSRCSFYSNDYGTLAIIAGMVAVL
jgi:hypothetical protein